MHSWSNSEDYSSSGLEKTVRKTVVGQLVSTLKFEPEASS
jgi:hypothetical protein